MELFEAKAYNWLRENNVEYVFLSCNIILKYKLFQEYGESKNKMFNCHPSLLPYFKGLNAVCRSFKSNKEYYEASIHKVTKEVDGGEVLARCVIKRKNEDFKMYQQRLFVNQAILFLDFIHKISLGKECKITQEISKKEGFYPNLSIDIASLKYLTYGDEKLLLF